ncbi:MAG: glutamine-hydrolyzing carbamoyl-phosphate synthase small subunit [Firmicutes bacterium]|nr:glutamine-hydrolyzing carbamoyl-phosphate synthase small subunit [Bacillota bacterium]
MEQGVLALENGAVFYGVPLGARGESWGEVVFNTGMTGYQEVLTDPSYRGQIVVMTYPLIGNYGVNDEDREDTRAHPRGFVVREACPAPSNWRATRSLDRYLAEQGIVGLAGVDTRALTRIIRSEGAMRGVIAGAPASEEELVARARSVPSISEQRLVLEVATDRPYRLPGGGFRVVVVDFGVKESIIRCLRGRGCDVVVVPPTFDAGRIMGCRPDGILLSNGPGDPSGLTFAVEAVRELLGLRPIFGICLGYQVLALALGGKTYKLKFGHRGANHPVKDLLSGRVYITSQNHGFAVEEGSLGGDALVTHRNANDGTVEGVAHRYLPAFGVQYHPEAGPGPRDSEYLFDRFLALMRAGTVAPGEGAAEGWNHAP